MFTKQEKIQKMEVIRRELENLSQSQLYIYRTENNYLPVVGEGDVMTHIMFVGEAPGKTEAMSARPFCGRSGKLLDEMIASIGLKREDVYITNVVKDRPQENRDPTPPEIELYAPFLDRQIEIIQPRVIVGLGRFSAVYVMERYGAGEFVHPIGDMHGQEYVGQTSYGTVTIVPLYHPAVALYNGSRKVELVQDFGVLKKYV